MSRIAYVNGRYVPHGQAAVHIEDRGFRFADGVYEVVAVRNGRLVDEQGHLDRLDRSLDELRLPRPMARGALAFVLRQMVRRNRVRDGNVYLQVTRGAAPRAFPFPRNAGPTLVVTARNAPPQPRWVVEQGVRVVTIPDIRWGRCDIKSVALLPAVLGKQQAVEAGAFEAWQVDGEGLVTEGTSSNAWIVTRDGRIVTRQCTPAILRGVTRTSILALAEGEGLGLEERPFTVQEATDAAEAFITSANTFVTPVVRIDDTPVGDGTPGPVARKLRALYETYMKAEGASRP